MNFLTTHPVIAIVILILVSLLLALFVGGLLHAAGRSMPRPSDIEPGALGDIETTASVAVELAGLGFEVKSWGPELQITDLKNAITFYMPKTATLEQCLDRYHEKLQQFKAA